ncbi:phospholipase C [Trichoderma parareesei]|uniref:Phosphoinositide phospholipase C n=1 Tax=Trichoderma parareesei TaxID=858221 RepID=A0A2H2ZTT1_TRIPA|nr:phospholipase C [Trichoderma parareesei]
MASDQDQPANASLQSGGGSIPAQRSLQSLSTTTLAYLKRLFDSHATPEGKWTPEQIRVFIQKVQGGSNSSSSDDVVLAKVLGTTTPDAAAAAAAADAAKVEELNLDGFLAYMTSPHSSAILPVLNEDLSWPLASYFISSSHNTYLTGNQLSSDSTTGAYTNVLLRGCRCVEIDVWDGDESDAESSDSSSSSESETSDDEAAAKKAALKEKKKKKEKKDKKDKKAGWSEQLRSKMDKINISKKVDKIQEKATEKVAELQEAMTTSSKTDSTAAVVEPRVLHGYTLTKDIRFRDVCEAIRESAFVASEMPLIVSLEVHCSPQQQLIMVDIMKQVWDGLLVSDPDSAIESLPSPEELRRKILIKVKYVPPGTPLDKVDTVSSEQQQQQQQISAGGGGPPPKPAKTIQELARMAIYTQGVTFKGWTQPEASMPTHIFSISEKKFIDYHEKQWATLFNHNKHYLLRAYPAGLRIGSSNLNPAIFWGGGAQIVALNWQETDEGMMLNEGMFTGTGGYVLKPEGYRSKLTLKEDISTPSPITIARKTVSLAFTFLSAQNLPLPPDEKSAKGFKPYVKVELHVEASKNSHAESDGHVHDSEYKVRTKTHKGCDLDLAGERLEFKAIPGLVEELTFVRFTVRDDEFGRDDLAAWACVKLDRLGQGYRFVHLRNTKGEATDGAILVKVEKLVV